MSEKTKKIFAVTGLILAILTFIYILLKIICWNTLAPVESAKPESTMLGGFNYLFYFTTISNIMVAVWLILWASNVLFKKDFKIVKNEYIQGGITCYIFVTMFVYWFFGVSMLGATIQDNFLYIIINFHLHLIAPVFYISLWFFPTSSNKLDYKKSIFYLIFPLAYFAIVEIKGSIDGWFPYSFLDRHKFWSDVFTSEFSDIGSAMLLLSACLFMGAIIYGVSLLVIKIRNSHIDYKLDRGEIL